MNPTEEAFPFVPKTVSDKELNSAVLYICLGICGGIHTGIFSSSGTLKRAAINEVSITRTAASMCWSLIFNEGPHRSVSSAWPLSGVEVRLYDERSRGLRRSQLPKERLDPNGGEPLYRGNDKLDYDMRLKVIERARDRLKRRTRRSSGRDATYMAECKAATARAEADLA